MAVDLADTKTHLNITDDDDDTELQFFIDAANEWIATQVDTSDLTAKPVLIATLELIRHWWQLSQLGPADIADAEADDVGQLRIPPIVHQMLGPYLSGSSTAAPPAALYSFPDAPSWPDPVTCW